MRILPGVTYVDSAEIHESVLDSIKLATVLQIKDLNRALTEIFCGGNRAFAIIVFGYILSHVHKGGVALAADQGGSAGQEQSIEPQEAWGRESHD
jgi:hypothetical protein